MFQAILYISARLVSAWRLSSFEVLRIRLGIGNSHTLINLVMDEKNKHSNAHISILLSRRKYLGHGVCVVCVCVGGVGVIGRQRE